MALKWKVEIRYQEEILYYEGDEALEQVSWRSCGYPIAGSVQSQVKQGLE